MRDTITRAMTTSLRQAMRESTFIAISSNKGGGTTSTFNIITGQMTVEPGSEALYQGYGLEGAYNAPMAGWAFINGRGTKLGLREMCNNPDKEAVFEAFKIWMLADPSGEVEARAKFLILCPEARDPEIFDSSAVESIHEWEAPPAAHAASWSTAAWDLVHM